MVGWLVIRRESRRHVREGRTDRRCTEKRKRKQTRVKVNINFVSRGGPDRAVRRPAGSTGEFCSSDRLGIVLSELIAVDSVSSRCTCECE